MRAIGDRTSDSTAELITASATAASVSGADAGKAAHFLYNTAAWHVGAGFHGVYEDRTFIHAGRSTTTPASMARAASAPCRPLGNAPRWHEQHFGRTPDQISHQKAARVDRSNYASVNHGTPAHPEGMGVNARQDRQQNRINQGVQSGQLTRGETTHIENNETAIHNEARTDRQRMAAI